MKFKLLFAFSILFNLNIALSNAQSCYEVKKIKKRKNVIIYDLTKNNSVYRGYSIINNQKGKRIKKGQCLEFKLEPFSPEVVAHHFFVNVNEVIISPKGTSDGRIYKLLNVNGRYLIE